MTPRQLERCFRAQADIFDREHKARAWLAWHVAALMRVKKLPRLERIAGRSPTRPQTPDEMLAIIKMLNAAYGGSVIRKTN
jgi:hypothetical protein